MLQGFWIYLWNKHFVTGLSQFFERTTKLFQTMLFKEQHSFCKIVRCYEAKFVGMLETPTERFSAQKVYVENSQNSSSIIFEELIFWYSV